MEKSKVLYWDKPEKIMSTEEWKSISADGAPPGVYCSNMSEEDERRWKAKLVGAKKKGAIRLIEIRKSFYKRDNGVGVKSIGVGCQCLIIVSLENIEGMIDCNVRMSMNGPAGISFEEWDELERAIKEAKEVLSHINKNE